MRYDFDKIGANYIDDINAKNFDNIALQVFQHQYAENAIYQAYCNAIHVQAKTVKKIEQIPFLPISFFKTHQVITGKQKPEFIFESSGTTQEITSKHYVTNAAIYEKSLLKGFDQYYGQPDQYAIVALLPSYLERSNASLVHMAKLLIEKSNNKRSGFYLNDFKSLHRALQLLEQEQQPTILLGVTFALLDFAEQYEMNLRNTIVMETGGMKGRREEWTRVQVHEFLQQRWQLNHVHAEYGMTELLSQAYSSGDGIFKCSNTMKLFLRDVNDPFEIFQQGAGCINIIDLANVNSCSFIATDDIGRLKQDDSFEVLGRLDHAALRGCSLMTA